MNCGGGGQSWFVVIERKVVERGPSSQTPKAVPCGTAFGLVGPVNWQLSRAARQASANMPTHAFAARGCVSNGNARACWGFQVSGSGQSPFVQECHEPVDDLRFFLQGNQGLQLVQDLRDVEALALAHEDRIHIGPVLIACGEGLVHHEILGAAYAEGAALEDFARDRAGDAVPLKGKCAQSDVQADVVPASQQEHAVTQGELAWVWQARLESTEKGVDARLLAAKSRQQRDVRINRAARISPRQHGQTADEAIPPTVVEADLLQLESRGSDDAYVRLFHQRAKILCCSTRPEGRVISGFCRSQRSAMSMTMAL